MRSIAILSLLLAPSCVFDSGGGPAGGSDGDGSPGADGAPPDASVRDSTVPDAPLPVHLYLFESGAQDSIGGANGTVMGSAVVANGRVVLDGGGWIELPAGAIGIGGFSEVSFEVWFSYSGAGVWQRVFDFGVASAVQSGAGADNVFFTPLSGDSDFRAAISDHDPGWMNEARAVGGNALATNTEYHLVVTLDADGIALYLDGAMAASQLYVNTTDPALGIPSIDQIGNSLALLGGSTYSDDPPLEGEITQFGVYDRALSAAQVSARFDAGPTSLMARRRPLIVDPRRWPLRSESERPSVGRPWAEQRRATPATL